jgi:hypothetical protein
MASMTTLPQPPLLRGGGVCSRQRHHVHGVHEVYVVSPQLEPPPPTKELEISDIFETHQQLPVKHGICEFYKPPK